jgi:hypothetical protein
MQASKQVRLRKPDKSPSGDSVSETAYSQGPATPHTRNGGGVLKICAAGLYASAAAEGRTEQQVTVKLDGWTH